MCGRREPSYSNPDPLWFLAADYTDQRGSGLVKSFCFCAEAFFGFAEVRSELRAKIFYVEDRTDVDFTFDVRSFGIVRYPLRPLDRFVHRIHFPDPETGDKLARLREWTIRHDSVAAGKLDSLRLRRRVQSFTRQHDSGIHQLFVELTHRVEQLLARHDSRF